jgi:2-oxo-4-hydroxy-4-carboxy--5-ureidoimidazoline (OHCU) decarboxylase
VLPSIDVLNALSPDAFVRTLAPLFEGAEGLLASLARARPFVDDDALFNRAREIALALPLEERRRLLDSHPAIGAPTAELARSTFAAREQGAAPAAGDVEAALRELNARYRERFGCTFVVFVNGRTRAEILPVLCERLAREPDAELRTGVSEYVAIARDRARRMRGAE